MEPARVQPARDFSWSRQVPAGRAGPFAQEATLGCLYARAQTNAAANLGCS
jgi:hypothetical protein